MFYKIGPRVRVNSLLNRSLWSPVKTELIVGDVLRQDQAEVDVITNLKRRTRPFTCGQWPVL
jgi:hypothetical protein